MRLITINAIKASRDAPHGSACRPQEQEKADGKHADGTCLKKLDKDIRQKSEDIRRDERPHVAEDHLRAHRRGVEDAKDADDHKEEREETEEKVERERGGVQSDRRFVLEFLPLARGLSQLMFCRRHVHTL